MLDPLKPQRIENGSRFGMALGKIGDINNDGFSDLAISGYSDEKGVIFIYHGSEDGLVFRQKIEMFDKASLFGFSISRGVDIDGNGYNDFAVSAPNVDTVYIYKSYPVISVQLTMNITWYNSSLEIPLNTTYVRVNDNINVSFCIKFESNTNISFPVGKYIFS